MHFCLHNIWVWLFLLSLIITLICMSISKVPLSANTDNKVSRYRSIGKEP